MNTVAKGDSLEDELYAYLQEQVEQGERVYGVYPPDLCKVRKKAKYFCSERKADVEFDVVVELRREDRNDPHQFVVFECKNHSDAVRELHVRDFSDKLRSVFGHAVKGLVVTTTRLQSGAENIARSRNLGIIKFDQNGMEIVADRTSAPWMEFGFVHSKMSAKYPNSKPLKFAVYFDGMYLSSFSQLLVCFEHNNDLRGSTEPPQRKVSFISAAEIRRQAEETLNLVSYCSGEVPLEGICNALGLSLHYEDMSTFDHDGNAILGSANFDRMSIVVYRNGHPQRERFTIAHEIGHFVLEHGKYLKSEVIVEADLHGEEVLDDAFNYERLEYQANWFASELLLPDGLFRKQLRKIREQYNVVDRGFGYLFVDDQPCNFGPYNQILRELSFQFGASKSAIEVKLKRSGLLTDQRSSQRCF